MRAGFAESAGVRPKLGIGNSEFNVSNFPKMDEPFAAVDPYLCATGQHRADGRYLVLSESEIFACGLSTDSAGFIFTCNPCRPVGNRLPLLS